MISMFILVFHLTGLQILRPVLTLLFSPNKYIFFDFSIRSPGKLISQTHKCNAILIHCLDEVFMSPSLT